jgi:hypothetical protein
LQLPQGRRERFLGILRICVTTGQALIREINRFFMALIELNATPRPGTL